MKLLDVLIVGAGPAGLTLACDLRRRGVGVRLLERLKAPANASKGKGLQPRTLELFDDLGIVQEVLANGRLYPPLRFYDGRKPVRDHVMMVIKEATADTPYPNTIMLPQWKTEEILRNRLAALGGSVEYDCEFLEFVQDEDRVVATVSINGQTQTIAAKYLVGADGARGAVRKSTGIRLDGDTPSLDGLAVADVRVNDVDRDHWHFWTNQGKQVGLCPLPSTDQFQFTARLAPGEEPELSLSGLQSLIDASSGDAKLVLHEVSWASIFRPNIRMAERFRAGRVFLVGDAAHVHPPSGAQGLNTSVQDSYNLGWKLGLVLQGAGDALLDTYDEERLPIVASVLGRTELLYRRGLSGDESAMRRGDDEQQLLLNYRGASLNGPASPNTKLQPGDRMPNARLRSSDGTRFDLFDLIRGPHSTVLALDTNPDLRKAPLVRGDLRMVSIGIRNRTNCEFVLETGDFLKELSGCIVSVRPDGYILNISR